jgi:hypothetical protein
MKKKKKSKPKKPKQYGTTTKRTMTARKK